MQREKHIEESEIQQGYRQKSEERSLRQSSCNDNADKNSKRNSLTSSNGQRGSVHEFRISLKDLCGGESKSRGSESYCLSKESMIPSPLPLDRRLQKNTSTSRSSSNDFYQRRRNQSLSKYSHLAERSRSNSPNPESNRQYNYFDELQKTSDCSRASEQPKFLLERENRDLQNSLQSVFQYLLPR